MVRKPRLLGPLGWRLFVAFILTTVGVVAVVALLAVFSVRHQTSSVQQAQVAQQRSAVVEALVEAYTKAGFTWQDADMAGVQALARASGARIVVLNSSGQEVFQAQPRPTDDHGGGTEDNPNRGGSGKATTPGGSTAPASSRAPEPGDDNGGGGGGGGSRGGSGGGSGGGATGNSVTTKATGSSRGGGEGNFVAPSATPSATPSVTPTVTPTVTPSGTPSRAANVPVVSSTVPAANGALAIIVNGQNIGTLAFDAPPTSPATQAQAAILRTVGIATLLAVVLAALAALAVSRAISRPLVGLAAAAHAVEEGEPDATALLRPGPGELGQVSRAFRQMADTLRREDELRRTLVADVAHELRTPVTILRGQTEQLLDGLAQPDAEQLGSLHEEVLRLDTLVEDLATLSAAEAAGLRMERTRLELADVLGKAVTAMRPQYTTAGVELTLDAESMVAQGDQNRLTQVFSNLLGNAVKFTPPGGTVSVRLWRDGACAVVTVADTGPGIAAADRAHVFDRFWRGKTGKSGTGIGLAVVSELVIAHGGTVQVDGGPGGGAVFTVRLPAG